MGEPSNIDRQSGRVILIEVFQVNCPGCFLYGFPEVISLYTQLKEKGLVVWGLATAFEDFEFNSLKNLRRLLGKGETVGKTKDRLLIENQLVEGRLSYQIPFPVAFDNIIPNNDRCSQMMAQKLINRDFPNFDQFPEFQRKMILEQVIVYLKNKSYIALTFDRYNLLGTPSTLLIDKKGVLRRKWFGSGHNIKSEIETLLKE